MKISRVQRDERGFTLMELLVVVTIIVILAGITLGGMSLVQQKTARDKAKVQIKLLESAIEDYQSDNKSYPSSPEPGGENGSEILFEELYNKGFQAKEKIYLGELDPDGNAEGKGGQGWIRKSANSAQIIDPWGNPYYYRDGSSESSINPDFDLWSAGKDGRTNAADPKHQDCQDDIRNW